MTLNSTSFEVANNVININGILYAHSEEYLYVRVSLPSGEYVARLEHNEILDGRRDHSLHSVIEMAMAISPNIAEMNDTIRLNGYGYVIVGLKPIAEAMGETGAFDEPLFERIPDGAPTYTECPATC